MDSMAVDDPSLPVDFEASANPGHLLEFSTNNQMDYTDTSIAGATSTLGQTSPFRTRTMKEYDQQISDLKKENFSLKLRIYFLEERMQQKFATHGKDEDISKDNIELKVELESLKRDLTYKQDLLFSASQALETLETQRQFELNDLKDKEVNEKKQLLQRIEELEKQLEKTDDMCNIDSNGDTCKRKSVEWFKEAFSIADLTVDNNESPGTVISTLQLKLSELENTVEDLSAKIENYQVKTQELEAVIKSKDEFISEQEKNLLKRDKTIQGFIEIFQEKNAECEELSKQLEEQEDQFKILKNTSNFSSNSNTTSIPTHDTCQSKSSSQDNDGHLQHQTLLFDLQIKDNKIQDLCEKLSLLKADLQSQVKDGQTKDELIANLRDSLSSAERNYNELLAESNKLSETEKTIEELKSLLREKESENTDAEARFNQIMTTKCDQLTNVEEELTKVNALVQELENKLKCKAGENESFFNQLLESKEMTAELQKKLQMRDDYFEQLKSCLDKMLFEEINIDQEPLSMEDEKITQLLNDFSCLGRILRKLTVELGGNTNKFYSDSQSLASSPDSGERNSPIELHHFDLIRDSHERESAVYLLSTNLALKKSKKDLQNKFDNALRDKHSIEEELKCARRQIDLLTKQNAEKLDEVADKDLFEMDQGKLTEELKNEMWKLKRQFEMMHQLNDLLQQQVDLHPTTHVLTSTDDAQQALISSLSVKTKKLRDEMKKFGNLSLSRKESDVNYCAPAEAQAEINRLQFVLSSTEGTVRMLGGKIKYYRSLLTDVGISPLAFGKTSHRSDTNITGQWCSQTNKALLPTLALPSSNDFLHVPSISEEPTMIPIVVCKSSSFSAPVTPLKEPSLALNLCSASNPPQHGAHLEELDALKQALIDNEQLLRERNAEIATLRRPSKIFQDMSCQTIDWDLNKSLQEKKSADSTAWQHISDTHHASELLRRRLEELADFLERLLQFDENGLLDISCLTPQKLASIRSHLERSRELSCTLSRSLLTLDNTMMTSELANIGDESSEHNSSAISVSGREVGGFATGVNSSTGNDFVAPSTGAIQRTPKSCSRSLPLSGITHGDQQNCTADDFLLLLKPESKASSLANIHDELPTCSLSAFELQQQYSFLSSTGLGDVAATTLGAKNKLAMKDEREERSVTESDSWSEPDRNVSQQRIGLFSNQVTPKKHEATSSSNTESEVVTDTGIHGRSGKGCSSCLNKSHLNSQELSLLAQVEELKEINASIRAELSLYQSICNDKGSPSIKKSPFSSPSKPQRRSRTRSGDISTYTGDNYGKSPKLEGYLREISALRKRLEESIRGYDLLREQFEKRLAASPTGNAEMNSEYANVIQNLCTQLENCKIQVDRKNLIIQDARNEKAILLAEIQELTEKFESYHETIESLRSMLGEQQKCAKETAHKVEHLEATVANKDRSLAEAKSVQEQLMQSVNKAKKLVYDNELALEKLRELNRELEEGNEKLKCECELKDREGKHQAEIITLLNKQLTELKADLESSQKIICEQKEDNESYQNHIQELQHSISANEIQVKNMIQEMEQQRMCNQQDLDKLQQEKSSLDSHVMQLQAELDTASSINRSLKTELQMLAKMGSSECMASESSQGDGASTTESGVHSLMSEIRSLHQQLERSVETNQALRAQLEKKSLNGCERQHMHLDIVGGGGNDQWPNSISSPDTASSFSYVSMSRRINTQAAYCAVVPSVINRQISKSSDYVSDSQNGHSQHAWEQPMDSASVYSSPDLGIESDRSRLSSLDRKSGPNKTQYLQPGMPGGDIQWTITNSAPPKTNSTHLKPFLANDSCGDQNANLTFPVYGRNFILDETEQSKEGSKSYISCGNLPNRKPYCVAQSADYNLLKKSMCDGVNLLRTIRSKAKERLLILKGSISASTKVIVRDDEYVAWKEVYLGCDALKTCLRGGCTLVGQFWTVPLPLVPLESGYRRSSETSGNAVDSQIEDELMHLYHELAKEKQRAEDALQKLEAANRLKVGMEKAIVKQLNKTHNVLMKAKGNLEQQTKSTSSPQK